MPRARASTPGLAGCLDPIRQDVGQRHVEYVVHRLGVVNPDAARQGLTEDVGDVNCFAAITAANRARHAASTLSRMRQRARPPRERELAPAHGHKSPRTGCPLGPEPKVRTAQRIRRLLLPLAEPVLARTVRQSQLQGTTKALPGPSALSGVRTDGRHPKARSQFRPSPELPPRFLMRCPSTGPTLVVCPLNKLTLYLRGVSTVRAGIAVRRPVRPRASNRKIISGTYH